MTSLTKREESFPLPPAIMDDGSLMGNGDDEEEASMELGKVDNSQNKSNSDFGSSNAFANPDAAKQLLEQENLHLTLSRQETRAVRILRVFVLLAMVGAALAVSILVYQYMKNDEEAALERNFFRLSQRVMDGFHANCRLRVQTLDSFATSLTTIAMATQQQWPFVTFPEFEAMGTQVRAIVGSDYLGLYLFVTGEDRLEWEDYSVENVAWLNESYAYQQEFKADHNRTVGARAPARRRRMEYLENYLADTINAYGSGDNTPERWLKEFNFDKLLDGTEEGDELDTKDVGNVSAPAELTNITWDGPMGMATEIYRFGTEEEEFVYVAEDGPGPYFVMWQVTPAHGYSSGDINYNILDPYYSPAYTDACLESLSTKTTVFAGVWNVDEEGYIKEDDDYDMRTVPAGTLFYPVFDKLSGDDKEVVAVMDLDVEFGALFRSVLPEDSFPVVCVMENTCNQVFTFEVSGERAVYLGPEDLHDPKYDNLMVQTLLTNLDVESRGVVYNGAPINTEFCPWVLKIYATQALEEEFISSKPLYYMLGLFGIFFLTSSVFVMYDLIVEYRQKNILSTAVNSEKVVAQLFPKEFREQLYENNKKEEEKKRKKRTTFAASTPADDWLVASGEFQQPEKFSVTNTPPMAALYPDCTVFFADIAGFTAWSSARSPTEVFTLLETIYGAFDKLARKYGVFKIETIGDCYVAVTGLPVAQPNHAFLMAKFARDVLLKMKALTRKLDSTLGPDTSTLAMRCGLNSGPVTAGVLRGEKARFQLFGDTVNTAARMESNGQRDCIHVSQSTADCLIEQGRSSWVHAREDKIQAKGKGTMQTYWVRPQTGPTSVKGGMHASSFSCDSGDEDDRIGVELALADMSGTTEEKEKWTHSNFRQIGWVADLFSVELKKMIQVRGPVGSTAVWADQAELLHASSSNWDDDMVKSFLDSTLSNGVSDAPLPHDVEKQVSEYISIIAFSFQNDRDYRNFSRACQVIMAMDKMLKKLDMLFEPEQLSPWVKFAMLLAAFIRDVDPPRMPSVEGDESEVKLLLGRVTEQKSVSIAFDLLMDKKFKDLRQALCPSKSELRRFWGLVRNLHLATDRSNGCLPSSVLERWEQSFGQDVLETALDKKVAPMLEHIASIAQESHAIQHWDNYVKWSKLQCAEYSAAFLRGELSVDPAACWQQSELVYFNQVVIPLTKNVDKAGVLGPVGSEFFKCASDNREEIASSQKCFAQSVEAPAEESFSVLDMDSEDESPREAYAAVKSSFTAMADTEVTQPLEASAEVTSAGLKASTEIEC